MYKKGCSGDFLGFDFLWFFFLTGEDCNGKENGYRRRVAGELLEEEASSVIF